MISHLFSVVLGGDNPLALPLILDLENKGYIVIASVSTSEAVESLESKCNGYVRALVLDPEEVRAMIRYWTGILIDTSITSPGQHLFSFVRCFQRCLDVSL